MVAPSLLRAGILGRLSLRSSATFSRPTPSRIAMPSSVDPKTFPCFAVAAVCRNRGLGFRGALPWRLKKEVAHFARLTKDSAPGKVNAIVVGRLTWDSFPPKYRPLPGRLNVVVSRTLAEVPEGHHVVRSLSDAFALLKEKVDAGVVDKTFVVGGAQIYEQALADPRCTRLYLTEIDADFECDAFFPALDPSTFREVPDESVPSEDQEENGIKYRFKVYERIPN